MSANDEATATVKRLALVAPTALSVLRSRGDLVKAALGLGHKVLALAPDAVGEDAIRLAEAGVLPRPIELNPPGFSILANRKAEKALAAVLGEWHPDVVLAYGSRAMAIGALAAQRAGVARIVSMVSAIPAEGFRGTGIEGMGRRHFVQAFKASNAIVVHNSEDASRLTAEGLVSDGSSITAVAGAGVDLSAHSLQPLPPIAEGLVFLLVAPLLRSRGVAEYARAAAIVRSRAKGARFLLAGPLMDVPDLVHPRDLGEAVEYLGAISDIRPLLARAHVYVYPSHWEGMPRTVLEALAAGRPVITTDVPGCRETVDERVNGCLVPPGDAAALADAMASFMKRLDLIPSMARASRTKAERRFDVSQVNATLLEVLGLSPKK